MPRCALDYVPIGSNMKFRFISPEGYDPPAKAGVTFGYDFRGGAVCDVTDEHHIRKLSGNRFFQRVEDTPDELDPRREFHEQATPVKRRRRKVAHGNDNKS